MQKKTNGHPGHAVISLKTTVKEDFSRITAQDRRSSIKKAIHRKNPMSFDEQNVLHLSFTFYTSTKVSIDSITDGFHILRFRLENDSFVYADKNTTVSGSSNGSITMAATIFHSKFAENKNQDLMQK
jgi:hypothetical protein